MDSHALSSMPPPATGALREIDELPGPRGLPLLGNLLQVDRHRIHQTVERWAREFGPYFRFSMPGRRFLVVADHEAIATVLRDRPEGFRRSVRLAQVWSELGLPDGVFGAHGDAWKRQRRMVMAGFDPSHVRAYFPSLVKVTQRLHGRWQKAARTHAAIDLQADLMRYTVDAITGLAFGADINTLESDADVIQHHLDKLFPALFKRIMAPLPLWRYVRLPSDRRLERSVAEISKAIDGFVAQAHERLRSDPARRANPPNLLEAMIVAAQAPDSGVDDRDVAGNVITMLLAGEDTTANTLAWMIHLLLRHPRALQRAQDEVRSLADDPATFTPDKLAALDYVEACINETMRLKPVAPFQAAQALRETRIADIRVPANTIVWCAMRGDSLSERHFAQATVFEPQRWLADNGPSQAAGSAKRVSMPFGAGPRVCPGRYLAMLEMKMATAMLLGRFDIDSAATASGDEAAEHLAFTMAPLGVQMRLRERT
jgi:cytochrome P450